MSIDLTQDYILEDQVAKLYPLTLEAFDLLLPFAQNEPELWQYSLLPANGADNLRTYMQFAEEQRAVNKSLPFIVLDKRSEEIAGSTRFYDYQPRHKSILLGYTWYSQKFWGSGLNKHCKYLMLEQAFEKWDLERVEFRADNKNLRSIAAMKSIGCVKEGVLRSNCASPSGRRDSIVMSILKGEWYTRVKSNLAARLG